MKTITTKNTIIDMPTLLLNPKVISILGTGCVGEVDISYEQIVKVFGKPKIIRDNNRKIDAEWIVLTPKGIATIYNYKTGQNYLGEDGEPTEQIRDWHIGGRDEKVVSYIFNALSE